MVQPVTITPLSIVLRRSAMEEREAPQMGINNVGCPLSASDARLCKLVTVCSKHSQQGGDLGGFLLPGNIF